MTEQEKLAIRAELARAMFPDAVIEPSPTGEGVDIRVKEFRPPGVTRFQPLRGIARFYRFRRPVGFSSSRLVARYCV